MRHTFELAQPHAFELPTLPGVASEGAVEFPVPEWVHVSPMPNEDDRIVSRDYRQLVIDSMEKLVKRSNAALKRQGGGGLVDKDHKSYGWFSDGTGAIAWAEEFALRDDGIYARTMWLEEGREAIRSGKWRYTSMVLNGPQEWVFDEDGYPLRLDIFPQEIEGFGITNTPALATLAMFAADEETMDKKIIETAIAKLGAQLGLDDTTVAGLRALPPEQLRQRLAAAPADRAMFTDESAEPDDAPATPAEIDAALAAIGIHKVKPDDDDEDEGADADADNPAPIASAELSKAQARIAELEATNRKLETDGAETFVASLVHSGKLTPAQRKAALELAKKPGGKASLEALYKDALPVVVNGGAPRVAAKTESDKPPTSVSPKAWALSADKTLTVGEMARQLKETDTP